MVDNKYLNYKKQNKAAFVAFRGLLCWGKCSSAFISKEMTSFKIELYLLCTLAVFTHITKLFPHHSRKLCYISYLSCYILSFN